jgi:hypothetical protein
VRWELSGTLNYVNPLLGGTFTVGQSFTIGMDLDETTPLSNGQRIDFYTSGGIFSRAASNGNVTFSNYSADFTNAGQQGGLQVRNNESGAAFGYDQVNLNFFSFEPGAVTAPTVDGHEVTSIEFNFYSDLAPRTMVSGNDATFPAVDVPFIGPDTFDLSRSNNTPYHFIIRFTGGDVAGTNFIRGAINSSSFSTGGGGGGSSFEDWPALAALPADQRDPLDTPANDGVPNLVKFAVGIDPLESAAGRIPQEVVEGTGAETGYPVVSFIRDTSVSGVSMQVEVSSDLAFTNDLGATIVSTEDLGDGTERVHVRSNASFAAHTRQFFRLAVTQN